MKRDVKDIPNEEGDWARVAVAIECVPHVDKVVSYITPDDRRGGVTDLDDVAQVRTHCSQTGRI